MSFEPKTEYPKCEIAVCYQNGVERIFLPTKRGAKIVRMCPRHAEEWRA